MLWIALYFPALSLDWIERRFPGTLIPAIAVTVRKRNQTCIQQANKPAQERGVMAGQPLASALAVFPDLVIMEQDLHEERKALQQAVYAALRFTPNIAMQNNGLIAEVSGSLKLFGGLKKLCQSLDRAVTAQGLQFSAGIAPTATGAGLLARSAQSGTVINGKGEEFRILLDALPVNLLESAQLHLDVIHGIGCKTLADLRRLPRGGIARRFGPDLPAELDRAYGDSPDPQKWFEAPEDFQQKMKMMGLVENAGLLLVPARRMVEQMCGWLASRHAAVSAFSFILHHEHSLRQPHKFTPVNIRLSEQGSDPAHLMLLLRARLERTKIVAPVCELELTADEIAAGADSNLELFPTVQSEATSLNRFIEKLSSRLGPEAITGLKVVSDHRPECSQRLELSATGGLNRFSKREAKAQIIQPESPRPAWLMETPLELKVQRGQPIYGSPLKLLAGPERIEAGWWDDAAVARDYFIAENDQGQLVWIYRKHSPAEKDKGNKGGNWYLQGLFG
ncbi:MAG: DNA polymerase IV-like protein ImuB [Nitrosomonadales bacterium SCN 54-20]|nr:MAG: DNA polymerase IV-like protein ImuB [Nitrosomonadales bacterium SCN 54-20]